MKYKAMFCIVLVMYMVCSGMSIKADDYEAAGQNRLEAAEAFVCKQMEKGRIPGLSIVVVKGSETLYSKSFGYSSNETKEILENERLFELGSASKAFTAAGIYILENTGRVSLEDPVDKYLPWFYMTYEGKAVKVTIEQLLHHTSGIPYNTIGDIPISGEADALEKTVRLISGKQLDSPPGDRFSYATINYDILGLIIEKVSGKSFEAFMQSELLKPLGLSDTITDRQEARKKGMAEGHKPGYGRELVYRAPEYKGNVPAGYIISNSHDMGRWLQLQMGAAETTPLLEKAIEDAQKADRTVPPAYDGSSYCGGWQFYQKGGGEYSHEGSNPNYSSFLVFRPEERLGVAVLSNMNSSYTALIGQGVMDILLGKTPRQTTKDMYMSLDYIAIALVCSIVPFLLISLWHIGGVLRNIFSGKRSFKGNAADILLSVIKPAIAAGAFAACLYMLPEIIFDGLPWSFLAVWAPQSIIVALFILYASGIVFTVYYYLSRLFPRQKDRDFFPVIVISVLSGLGNALIIFIINIALGRFQPGRTALDIGLLFYFVLGIAVYVLGQRLVRLRLITVTNDIVFEKRMSLIGRILWTSYQDFEQLEKGDMIACLNNDTDTISTFANIIISAVANSVTLACCFIYLGLVSLWGLAASIAAAFLALGFYFAMGASAEKLWEKVRDNQSVFIKYIDDLIYGFKELSLNSKRRSEFRQDIEMSCNTYRMKNIQGNFKFANVFVIGELLFTFVIGIVVFIFPVMFKEIEGAALVQYVFIFLYMTGPIHGILDAVPEIMRVRISWNRIKKLEARLYELPAITEEQTELRPDSIEIELKNVEFKYKGRDNGEFKVGPLSCSFKPGEITFITGGNGSGKSTLAKLITGLYKPDSGEILVNGSKLGGKKLGSYYSAIFSDYYLFDKLYGIDWEGKRKEIDEKLKQLCIEDKLTIENGVLSSTRLSTGQRKRVAFMISHLEDRPVCLFDEWAADQDPEFRRVFYTELLPELKKKGKCIIAITHDDRYFSAADKVIKMEMGSII